MESETKTRTVYEELLDAVSSEVPFQAQSAGETEQVFLQRLISSVATLSDVKWGALSGSSQEWYNNAAAAANQMQPFPACPGYQSVIPEVAEAAAVPAVNGNAAEPKAAKAISKRGVMQRAREITLGDPQRDYKLTMAQIEEEGFGKASEDTVWLCVSEVRNVLKAAEAAGYKLVKVDSASA